MDRKKSFFKEFFSFQTNKEKGVIGFQNALGVGAWDIFNSGSSGLIGSWLLYFLTTFGGVNPGIAALLISARLFVDMIWAPIVATISDNFYRFAVGRKYGRRRFFLIFSIPTSFAFVLMWIPVTIGFSWLYYLLSFILFDFCLDLIMIPWETLPAEMTEDFTQRNKMGTIRMWAGGLAQPLITVVPSIFMKILPPSNGLQTSGWALFATAVVWGITGLLLTYFVYIYSWDPILISEKRKKIILDNLAQQKKDVENPIKMFVRQFSNLALTLRVKTFRKHLVLYFSTFGIIDSYTTIFVIFTTISFLPKLTIDPAAAGVILAIPLLIMTLVFSPISSWLINHPKFGPKKMYIIGFLSILIACSVYGVTYFGRESLSEHFIYVSVLVASSIFTLGRQFMGSVPWIMFPMMADIDEIISKDKRAGIYAGTMSFVRKMTNAVFNILIGLVMGIAGYNQHISQTADKIIKYHSSNNVSIEIAYKKFVTTKILHNDIQHAGRGIAILMIFFIGAMVIWAMWNAVTFKLNSVSHAILMNEIKRLRDAALISDEEVSIAKANVNPETKKVVEELTGLSYEKYVWSGDLLRRKNDRSL